MHLRRRRAGVEVFPDHIEHFDRARRHRAGRDRGPADDADHHHRRDRHLGRLDGRPLRGDDGGVPRERPADRGGDARSASSSGCWPAPSTASSSSTACCPRWSSPSARWRSIAASPRSSSRSAASAAFPSGTRRSASARIAGTPIPWSSIIFIICFIGFADLPAPDPLGPGALRDRQQPRGRPLLRHQRQARDPRRLRGVGSDVGARRRWCSPPISRAPAPTPRPGSSCR